MLALTSLLLALVVHYPAAAQEGTQQFSNADTKRLYQEYQQKKTQLDQAQAAEDSYANSSGDFSGTKMNALQDRRAALEHDVPRIAAELARARLQAIQDAPVKGTGKQQIKTLSAKRDALQALSDWSNEQEQASTYYDYTITSDIDTELDSTKSALENLQASQSSQANQQQVSSNDNKAGTAPAGPLVAIGSAINGFISLVFALIFWTLLILLAMFVVAWRREGSSGAALSHVAQPRRVLLAVGVACVLWLLGPLALPALLIFAIAYFFILRRIRGGAGGTGRVRSWFPRGGGGTGGEPDEGRIGRNVAGAKGEAKVNQILASLTTQSYCYVFANLWEDSVGNIDHILISRAGPIIIETKANSGEAVLDENGKLTAGGNTFSRDPFDQASRQLDALSRRIGLSPGEGDYYVCLAAAKGLQLSPGAPNAGRLLMIADLAGVLTGVEERISERDVDRLAEKIMGIYGTAPIASPSSGPSPTGPTVGGPRSSTDEDSNHSESSHEREESPRQALEKMLRDTARSFGSRHGVDVTYTDEALDALLTAYARERKAGHPSLKRVIDSRVGTKLSDLLSAGKVGAGGAVELAVKNGQVAFRRVTAKVRTDGSSGGDEPPEEGPPEEQDGDEKRERYCPECSSEVSPDARFCGQCGDPMTED